MAALTLSSTQSGETSQVNRLSAYKTEQIPSYSQEEGPQARLRAMLQVATHLENSIRHTREMLATLLH